MRKLLLFAFAVLCTKLSFAQITKGNLLLGGNISYTHSKPKDFGIGTKTAYSYLDGTMNAGYFVVNKLAPGVRLSAIIGKTKTWRPDNSKQVLVQHSIGFGPFLRYYILSPDKKLNVFSDGSLLYNINSNNSNDVLSKSLSSSLGAGAVLFLNPNVGLEGLLSYSHYTDVNADFGSSSNSLQFKIGLQVHLRKTN
jgi:hypothetical protein